jgi:hypothetical protein
MVAKQVPATYVRDRHRAHARNVRRYTALRLLSSAHAEILRLADEGVDADGMAARLSLEPAAVGPALAVARAKLAALEAREEPESAPDKESEGQ